MLLRRSIQITLRVRRKFGGGHVEKPYDWRYDPVVNPFAGYPPEYTGVENMDHTPPCKYVDPPTDFPQPTYQELTSPYINYQTHQFWRFVQPAMPPQQTDKEEDVEHEMDYGSEDTDHQPAEFETQHFLRGTPFRWSIVLFIIPFWFFFLEIMYSRQPDHVHYRKPHPYFFGHPEENHFDEFEMEMLEKPHIMQYYIDTGMHTEPKYKIVDGKLVFDRFAGVNQPLPEL